MPKTLTEIKKLSAYPENFAKAIHFIKITQEYTMEVVESIEKLINVPLQKQNKPNDLERFASVAQKYMPYFVSGSFYEALQATANVCILVAKQEREAQMEAFQRVVTPMKSWILEDYPRLMKDIKKCYYLKDKMDRSMASVEARKTPERLMRAQEAKNKHQLFFERVENEVMRYKAVHRHHMQCLKVLMMKSYQFERKAKDEFYKAFTKCEAEINASIAALKETTPNTMCTTVEEIDKKESKKENEKQSTKKLLNEPNVDLNKPEKQTGNGKLKKMDSETNKEEKNVEIDEKKNAQNLKNEKNGKG